MDTHFNKGFNNKNYFINPESSRPNDINTHFYFIVQFINETMAIKMNLVCMRYSFVIRATGELSLEFFPCSIDLVRSFREVETTIGKYE